MDIVEKLTCRVKYRRLMDPADPIAADEAEAAALIASQARRIEELEAVYAAARGLCYGEDWNNGAHAKSRGYRKKLVAAVNAIEPLPALINRGEG